MSRYVISKQKPEYENIQANGTGICWIIRRGFIRYINFTEFTWDGHSKDDQNRPLLLTITNARDMPAFYSSQYPQTIIRGASAAAELQDVTIAIESSRTHTDVKMTASAVTDRLYVGIMYIAQQV